VCPGPKVSMTACLGPQGTVVLHPGSDYVISTCPGPRGALSASTSLVQEVGLGGFFGTVNFLPPDCHCSASCLWTQQRGDGDLNPQTGGGIPVPITDPFPSLLQVESSDTPKDTAAVPKCPPPCPEASPAEPLPNGDLEADGAQWKGTEEGGASPKSGRPEEDETESLADGETGRALENGRCTPKEGLDAPADEGELAPSDPQKKRGRRKLLEATEKSKI